MCVDTGVAYVQRQPILFLPPPPSNPPPPRDVITPPPHRSSPSRSGRQHRGHGVARDDGSVERDLPCGHVTSGAVARDVRPAMSRDSTDFDLQRDAG